jgi:hypothetical protein
MQINDNEAGAQLIASRVDPQVGSGFRFDYKHGRLGQAAETFTVNIFQEIFISFLAAKYNFCFTVFIEAYMYLTLIDILLLRVGPSRTKRPAPIPLG